MSPRTMPFKSTGATSGCNLCQGVEFETVGLKDRKQRPLHTVVCKRCGLVSHGTIPSEAEIARYYENEYRKDYHAELTPSPQRVVREWKRGQELLRRMQPFLRPKDRVFEVGAGIGCNVKQFELAGFRASGIEPGDGFRQYSRDQLGAQISAGFLEEQKEESQFDVVLLVHVLEHLRDPLASLTHLRKMLQPGGRLYVEVPNVAGPHAAPGKLFHYAHIFNFTHLTLRMLGEAAGLTVKHQFTPLTNKNVAILFTKGAQQKWILNPESYAHTMSGLKRYSQLTYHLRPSYWVERVSTIARHSSARFGAKSRAKAIVTRCQAVSPSTKSSKAA
jgi:2-polyprenyl-3-methyl-5-hydroxy-6-metoxy-1,4-benzoquinol methylase